MQLASNLLKSQDSGPILITGHTGFKGSWLSLLLKEIGIRTIGLSLPPTPGALYSRLNNTQYVNEYFIDIRDNDSVSKLIKELKPSVIFHLAAQPLVIESYSNPRETFEINVMGTANILDAFFKNENSSLFVGITTDKVYENNNSGINFKETDPLLGKDPYSASKVGTENVLASWRQISDISGGPKILSLRAGNVIGGGDFAADRIIPDIIRGIIDKKNISVRNPKSTRPWQHVLDPLMGYVKAADFCLEKNTSETFNFGPNGDSLSVANLVQIAINSWAKEPPIIEFQDSSPKIEAVTLQLDSSKSKKILNWEPVWTQELAIEDSFKWWNSVLNAGESADQACKRNVDFLLKDSF